MYNIFYAKIKDGGKTKTNQPIKIVGHQNRRNKNIKEGQECEKPE